LAEKFLPEENESSEFIIAESDATKNEYNGVQVEGLPTLLFFPKGSDKAEDQIAFDSSDRSLEALEKFVLSGGTEFPAEPEGGPEDDMEGDYESDDYEGEEFDDYEDYDDELSDDEEDVAYLDEPEDFGELPKDEL